MPGVSADVFITLVLALLSVTTILTAGVDMRSPAAPPRPSACVCVCFCMSVWNLVFLVPYSDNFLCVNKKSPAIGTKHDRKKSNKKWKGGKKAVKKKRQRKGGELGYKRGERGQRATRERQRLVMPVSIWQVATLWRWTGGRDGAPDLSQNATCHRAFMSLPAKQYVRGIKNHYALSELCCYGIPQKNNH